MESNLVMNDAWFWMYKKYVIESFFLISRTLNFNYRLYIQHNLCLIEFPCLRMQWNGRKTHTFQVCIRMVTSSFLGEPFGSYSIHCSFYSSKTIVYSIMKCNFVLQNWKNLTWTVQVEQFDSKNPTQKIRVLEEYAFADLASIFIFSKNNKLHPYIIAWINEHENFRVYLTESNRVSTYLFFIYKRNSMY